MTRAALVFASIALAGCTSLTTLGRARTIPEGRFEIAVAPGLVGAFSDRQVGVLPRIEAQLAYGATREVELDLKVWYAGIAAGTRLQLVRSASENDGFDLAFAPVLAYQPADKIAIDLPLLGGWNVGGASQLVLGIRPSYVMWLGAGGLDRPVSFLFLGGTLGFVWQIDPAIALLSELAVSGAVFHERGFGTPGGGGAMIQLSLGIAVRP
jgi:hypothetical protein